MRRHLAFACVVLLACTGLRAGEAVAEHDARRFDPPKPFLRFRAHDLVRSQQRVDEGAYGRLLASPSGQLLKGQIELALKEEELELATFTRLLGVVGRTVLGFGIAEGGDMDDLQVQFATELGTPDDIIALMKRFDLLDDPPEGQQGFWLFDGADEAVVKLFGNTLALRVAEDDAAGFVLRDEILPDLDPAADLEADFVFKVIADAYLAWAKQREWQNPEEDAVVKLLSPLHLTGTVTLTDAGIRERFTCDLAGIFAELRAAAAAKPKVPKEILATLPGTTLWAVTWSEGLEVLAVIPREAGLIDRRMDEEFIAVAAIIEAIEGPGLFYVEQVDGKFVWTLQQGMTPNTGALVGRALKEEADEIVRDIVRDLVPREFRPTLLGGEPGQEPQLPPVHTGYVDGSVIVTNHPQGVAGVTDRAGGFATLPAVKESFDQLPADAVILGLSHSPESWRVVGEFITKATTRGLEAPLLNTLAADFSAAAKRGWLYADIDPDGKQFVIESEGLLGFSTGFGSVFAWMLLRFGF